MAVLQHVFDFDHGSTSDKFSTHRKHLNGMEAPRNSLDVQLQSSHCLYTQDESIPFSVQLKRNSSSATPTKPWVDREKPKQHKAKQSAPSVVARLMGVDELPSEVKPSSCEGSRGCSSRTLIKKEQNFSKKFNHRKEDEPFSKGKQDPFHPKTCSKLAKPFLNMHPQEQQLQKFKKEFEAWHNTRIWESSRGCGLDSKRQSSNDYQALAQERLNREKLIRYADAKRNETNEKPPEMGYNISSRSGTDVQGNDFLQENKSKVLQQKKLESMPMQHVNRNSHCDEALSKRCDEQEIRSLPARIVLLKPGPERFEDLDRSNSDSEGKIKEGEGNISDFLEQVKERLILGMKSSAVEDVERHNTRTNISCFGKPLNPKEVDQETAKQERDCVVRDTGSIQSESSKSHGSDVQTVEGSIERLLEEVKERLILVMEGNEEKDFKRPGRQVKSSHFNGSIPKDISQQTAKELEGNVASNMSQLQSKSMLSQSRNAEKGMPGSPIFINRDTQKLLSEVSHAGIPKSEEAGKSNSICNKGEICLPGTRKKVNHQNGKQHKAGLAAKTLLHNLKSKMVFEHDVVSSGSPDESTLAPVYGTALRKLPTEDQSIFSGAHINSNHEIADNRDLERRKRKKHRFSLKWKASNLNDSLTFRNKLFGKKIQSAKRSADEFASTSSLVTLPSVSRNLSMWENSAAVPPTPASSSSDNQDDTCCEPAYHYSPVSTLDTVPFSEDVPVQEAFKETSSDQQVEVPELNQQMHQSELKRSAVVTQRANEGDAKTEGNPEAYLRDVLAAAGFFDDMDGILSMWDSPATPIRSWIFDEVEEAHREQIQDTRGIMMEHKLLFDLLNEALASKLCHLPTNIAPGRSIISSSVVVGNIEQLLNAVCGTVCKCIQSTYTGDDTINGLVEKSLQQNQWFGRIQGDVELIGRQLEKVVLKELIEDVVFDLLR